MNADSWSHRLRSSIVSLAAMLAPLVAAFYLLRLTYLLLSPRSDAILDGVVMFLLATFVLVTSRRTVLLIQLTALGLLLCMSVWSYSDIYMRLGIVDTTSQIVRDRESCLYFSIVTLTRLGYGDYRPTLDARMVAATQALTGYVFFGVLISMLSSYAVVNGRLAWKDRQSP